MLDCEGRALARGAEVRTDRQAALQKLFAPFESLPFDDLAAQHYAAIRHELESSGAVIGPNDLKIAAICRSRGVTLVTANQREFAWVSGMSLENWTAD